MCIVPSALCMFMCACVCLCVLVYELLPLMCHEIIDTGSLAGPSYFT